MPTNYWANLKSGKSRNHPEHKTQLSFPKSFKSNPRINQMEKITVKKILTMLVYFLCSSNRIKRGYLFKARCNPRTRW